MLNALKRLATDVPNDLVHCARVCNPATSAKWLFNIVSHANECRRSGNLTPADRGMGKGPFPVRRKHAQALISSPDVFGVVREIWFRDVYLQDDYLEIAPNAVVLDLGANAGVFTLLALAHGPEVRVVSVEPHLELNQRFRDQMALNGWQDRVTLHRAFIGGNSAVQQELLAQPEYAGARFMTQEELIDASQLTHIDFLKCDIEGSEFELLHEGSPLLAMTRQLAIEIHDRIGDRYELLSRLERCGFEIGPVRHSAGDCVALARRVRPQP